MILFCEYYIPEEHRGAFTNWTVSHGEQWQGAELLENIDQPGVYVEIWPVNTMEQAMLQEKERREGRSWIELEQWIKGGREGVRIWTFCPVLVTGKQA